MNLRTPLILFGVLLGLVAVFLLFQMRGVKTTAERKESEKWLLASLHPTTEKFSSVNSSEFHKVVIDRQASEGQKAEKLEFKREDGNWKLVSPKNVRVSGRAVDSMIDQFVSAQKEKEADLSGGLEKFGLDKPHTTVTLVQKGKDGEKVHTINLGKDSGHKNDAVLYVTTHESPKKPLAVSKSRIDKVFTHFDDFRDKDLLGSNINVTGVRLAGAQRRTLDLEKPDGKDWKFKEPKLGDADAKSVDDLVNALSNIKVANKEDFVADTANAADKLAQYGLAEDKAAYAITFRHKADDPKKSNDATLLIGAKDEQAENRAAALRDGAMIGEMIAQAVSLAPVLSPLAVHNAREKTQKENEGTYFARLKDDHTVVRLDGKQLKVLEKKIDELRSKSLAKVDATKVDAINLTHAGETLRFRRPDLKVKTPPPSMDAAPAPSEWNLYTDSRAHVKTHLDTVTKLIDAVNKVEIADPKAFLDDEPRQRAWFDKDPIDLGLDKPQAEIAIWQDGIQRDKDGKPESSGEPQLKDAVRGKPALKLFVGRKDDKRKVVYVKKQEGDDANNATILAIPDPWRGAATSPPQSPMGGPPPDLVSLNEVATAGFTHYRDHVLPSFKPNEVTQMVVTRGNQTYELVKDEKKDDQGSFGGSWLLKKPVEAKAGFGADSLLFQLASLSADKLITDRASERDRKDKFGLVDKPWMKVVVTAKDKDKKDSTYTYVIGKQVETDAKDPQAMYARVEVKPAEGSAPEANGFVFLVPWEAIRTFDNELRDNMIFPLETSGKPEEATFTWIGKDKKPTKLVLALEAPKEGEKKAWQVKSLTVDGKDAKANLPKLDVAKLEKFLGTAQPPSFGGPSINPLMTERFLVQNGKPEAAWRLDPASKDNPPPLTVEVKYDNKSTRTLTVGEEWKPKKEEYPGLRGTAYYYATASSVPNAVFAVNGTDFKDLLAGVEYFKAQDKMALK